MLCVVLLGFTLILLHLHLSRSQLPSLSMVVTGITAALGKNEFLMDDSVLGHRPTVAISSVATLALQDSSAVQSVR